MPIRYIPDIGDHADPLVILLVWCAMGSHGLINRIAAYLMTPSTLR